jgi:hypothetical protein
VTTPAPGGVGESAVVDGVDVDAVAAAVRQCDGVSGLDGGLYHEVATYLPGRTVDGVSVDADRVQVQVRSRWGVEAPLLATLIQITLAPLVGSRPVDVTIADIDDPPDPGSAAPGRARRTRQSPGLPPA